MEFLCKVRAFSTGEPRLQPTRKKITPALTTIWQPPSASSLQICTQHLLLLLST